MMMLPFMLPFLMVLAHFQPLIIAGEQLTYEVSSARLGRLGQARFTVTTLDSSTVRLAFDFEGRVLIFKASDHTFSELHPRELRTLRYGKRERSPVGRRDENVVIDYTTSTWTDQGQVQTLAAADALDELSFIYLIRSIELEPGAELTLHRHFDAARNPVKLRALPADPNLAADVIEMSVPDPRQKNGSSVLRFYISRDARRVPLRIESAMPMVGRLTMTLVGEL